MLVLLPDFFLNFYLVQADVSFSKLPALSYDNNSLWRTYCAPGLYPAFKCWCFFWLRSSYLNLGIKKEEKDYIPCCERVSPETCLPFAIYSKYFWNSCRRSNESHDVEWECGNIHLWRPCILQLYSRQKGRLLCVLLNTASMINLKGYILLNPGVDALCQPTFTAS